MVLFLLFGLMPSTQGIVCRIVPLESNDSVVILSSPDDWSPVGECNSGNYYTVLVPTDSKPNPKRKLLEIKAYSSGTNYRKTQADYAARHLKSLRQHQAPDVEMKEVRSFRVANAEINVYRFASGRLGFHFLAWIRDRNVAVEIDLHGRSERE